MVSSHCMNLTVCFPKKKINHFLHFINLLCVCVSVGNHGVGVAIRGVLEINCLLLSEPFTQGAILQYLCLILNWYWCCRNKKQNVIMLLWRIKETKVDRPWSEVWSPQKYGGIQLVFITAHTECEIHCGTYQSSAAKRSHQRSHGFNCSFKV